MALLLLLAGCTTATPTQVVPPPSAATPLAVVEQDFLLAQLDKGRAEEAVTVLILAERQAAIDQDLALLGALWATDARIVDGRNSVTPEDDYIWQGRAAILDRYRVAVFPFALPPLAALDAAAEITVTGAAATVRHGPDVWQLRKAEQRWWLTALRYQLAGRD